MEGFAKYITAPAPLLLEALARLDAERAFLHTELGTMRADERREKARAYQDCSPTVAISARDREAQMAALHHTVEILTMEGQLTALDIERDFVYFILHERTIR